VATEKELDDVLGEFARTMATDLPVQSILDHLVQRIVEILPISAAGVTLISNDLVPRYVAASGKSALRYEQLQTELAEGPCLMAYRSGVAVSVPDLEKDERFAAFRSRALADGLAAVWTFPLRQGDNRLGALALYRGTPGELGPTAMGAAQILADVTSAYLVNAQARSDLQGSSKRSQDNSRIDGLTGSANRALLIERLDHVLSRSSRSDKIVAVLYIGLDGLKQVNDNHGHACSDTLLVAVARRIRGLLRPGDTLARMSGDEFVVLCEDLDGAAQAGLIATRLVASLAGRFHLVRPEVDVQISASVGTACARRGDHLPERILHDADVAMYQAKRRGGGHYGVVDLRVQELDEFPSSLAGDLRGAVDRGELHNDYQPIVATIDGRIVGAEALVRWDHPTRGLIEPTVMVPLAEASGLITKIGRWVLERACADRQRWCDGAAGPDFAISVNVSPRQLMGPSFVTTVATALHRTRTPPGSLSLEVTEGVFSQDIEHVLGVLGELKQMGVKIVLDDFGTGYSSLTHLRRLPIDIVKLDPEIISNILADRSSRSIVTKVVELAHLLEMGVVAEGVETAEQHQAVAALGSEGSQGFYFARPMSADDLGTLIQKTDRADLCLPVEAV
jgi:diguanylate cyclase (GGDEF)-like protein